MSRRIKLTSGLEVNFISVGSKMGVLPQAHELASMPILERSDNFYNEGNNSRCELSEAMVVWLVPSQTGSG